MTDYKEILSKVDIVEVISEYVDLDRKGKNYFGICPFHDDSNPSMSVSTEKQIYKCFSCGAGGDAITFIKDIENISFKEALNKLAMSVGITIEEVVVKPVDKYFDIYSDASKFFTYSLLHTKEQAEYRDYLLARKFDLQVLEKFHIGFSDNKIKMLLEKKYEKSEVEKTKLFNANQNLVFQRRILFPIADSHGNVVGFSGRVINDETPKYLNTPETKYFKKREILYNFHQAKAEIEKQKYVIITEGYFDVIRLHMNGYMNAVATMGTEFSDEHAQLIKGSTNKVYLCMDGDVAGLKASYSIYNKLSKFNFEIFIVELFGLDVDEFILNKGIEQFKMFINHPKLYEEFYVTKLLNGYLDLSIAEKEQVMSEVKAFVRNISYDLRRSELEAIVYEKTGYNIGSTFKEKKPVKRVVDDSKSIIESYFKAEVANDIAINKKELEFISLMLNSTNAKEAYKNDIRHLNIKSNDEVAMHIVNHYILNRNDDIIEYINNSDEYSTEQLIILKDIIYKAKELNIQEVEEIVNDYVTHIIVYKYKKKIEKLTNDILNEPNIDKQKALLEKLGVLKVEMHNLNERRRSYNESN